jgi:hypothetical protein
LQCPSGIFNPTKFLYLVFSPLPSEALCVGGMKMVAVTVFRKKLYADMLTFENMNA